MYRITKSRLTGHWVINHGLSNAQGFRRWEDALTEVNYRLSKIRRVNLCDYKYSGCTGDQHAYTRIDPYDYDIHGEINTVIACDPCTDRRSEDI